MRLCLPVKPFRGLFPVFVLLLVISFAALSMTAFLLFGNAQTDLTADRRFTLSRPTQDFLKSNRQPLFITFYISPDLAEAYPAVGRYSEYVLRFSEQYKNAAERRLNVEVIPTAAFTAAEKEAQRRGIRGFLDKKGRKTLYFGAVLSNDAGEQTVIPYFEPRRRPYLEHDLTRALARLQNYEKPVVGIISPQSAVMPSDDNFDTRPHWSFVNALSENYRLEWLNPDKAQIPLRIKTLLVYNPRSLSPMSLYALDQYLLRGGNLILLPDPFSETELALNRQATQQPSGLEKFLAVRGIRYSDNAVVGDASLASPALYLSGDRSAYHDYPLWLELEPGQINADHAVTAGIKKMLLKSAGALSVTPPAYHQIDYTALLATTDTAGLVSAESAMYSPKSVISDSFRPSDRSFILALLAEGEFPSLYDAHPLSGTESERLMFPFLPLSVKPGRLMVIADSDFIFAPEWDRTGLLSAGAYDTIPGNQNFDFLENAVDYMSDNKALPRVAAAAAAEDAETAAQVLRGRIDKVYAPQRELYDALYRQSEEELRLLKEKDREEAVLASAAAAGQREILQRRLEENRRLLRQLDEKTDNEFEAEKRRLMIMTGLFWPLMLILLFALLHGWLRRQTGKRAGEIADV